MAAEKWRGNQTTSGFVAQQIGEEVTSRQASPAPPPNQVTLRVPFSDPPGNGSSACKSPPL